VSTFGIANTLITWKRQTAFMLSGASISASPATIALTYQPIRETALSLKPTGSPTGTIVVTGTVGGSAGQTETLTWAGTSVYRETKKLFTAVSNISAASLTGGVALSVEAKGTSGSPQHSLFTVKGPGHPIRVEDVGARRWSVEREGAAALGTHRLIVQFEEVWTPRKGDIVIDDLRGHEYLVVGRPVEPGDLFPYEWVCPAIRRDDSQGT